ncbi:hypothetical protein PanWU01x14_014340, partial [Parasponia andersonii]
MAGRSTLCMEIFCIEKRVQHELHYYGHYLVHELEVDGLKLHQSNYQTIATCHLRNLERLCHNPKWQLSIRSKWDREIYTLTILATIRIQRAR